jgi:hypothetical protein
MLILDIVLQFIVICHSHVFGILPFCENMQAFPLTCVCLLSCCIRDMSRRHLLDLEILTSYKIQQRIPCLKKLKNLQNEGLMCF